MHQSTREKFIERDLVFPMVIWALVILAFLHVKDIPYDFQGSDKVAVRYFVKFVMLVLFPLAIIHLFQEDKSDFGIYFPKLSASFKLSIRAYAIGGPAGITFVLIGLFGWGFQDWKGALILSLVYGVVLYFTPKVTNGLPTRTEIDIPNNSINVFVILSLLTVIFAYFTYEAIPVIAKMLYYVFIVGLGEELFFRGYLQSSFNRYFGKPFSIGKVRFGWGLLLSAILFGLIHALVVTPPLWPWALFTFVLGLILGFIREKDGSILAAILLHAMFDLPLAFL